MMLTGRPFLILLLLWTLVVPAGTVYLFTNFPLSDVNWIWMSLSIIFGFFSLYFPIIHNGKSIYLFVWFTLPIFLLYGLTAELFVTQIIVMMAVLSRFRTGDVLYRLLYNSLAYFLLSVLSAAAFSLVISLIGSLAFSVLILGVFAYQLVYSLLYNGLFSLYSSLTKRMRTYTAKERVYHYFRLMLVVPLAVSLYYMLIHYGAAGYLFLGIPYLLITALLRMNHRREDLSAAIRTAGQIGHRLARMTKEKEVIEEYMTKTAGLFSADYVYLYSEHDGWLEPSHFYADGKKQPPPEVRLGAGQGIAGRLLSGKATDLYSRRDQWIGSAVTDVPRDIESLMCIPLIRQQQVVGGVVLGSKTRSAFKEFQLKVLDLLSSYFVVASEKAVYIERAEKDSQYCSLTGLPNYKYLEEYLEQSVRNASGSTADAVSVVMLDIDRFKSVNDTYGHESGNRVLQQLAGILEEHCPKDGIICRYGGEEFVYALNGWNKKRTAEFAEELRRIIESTPMDIQTDLACLTEDHQIHITSSFGVASFPEDTDEAMGLLRNADRALYIGAKHAGRNRVGTYVK